MRKELHIIAEARGGTNHWVAWFEDEPENGYGGETPIAAVQRLLNGRAERVPEFHGIRAVGSLSRRRRREFILYPKVARTLCPECRGTGKYVGLSVVEDCRACGGSGRAEA